MTQLDLWPEPALTGKARAVFEQVCANRPDQDTPQDLYKRGYLIVPGRLPGQWVWLHIMGCSRWDTVATTAGENMWSWDEAVQEARWLAELFAY